MSKFNNITRAVGEDSNPLLLVKLDELKNVANGDKLLSSLNGGCPFNDGEILKFKGYTVMSGEFFKNDTDTEGKKFSYVAIVLVHPNGEEDVFSLKALRVKKFDDSTGKAVERPELYITDKNSDKYVGKNVKCVRKEYWKKSLNGTLKDDQTDVCFIPIS